MTGLLRSAEQKLSVGPFTVVFNDSIATSGDPHDIVSTGPYWWPNPDTPDGLPWVSTDGHINPNANLDWDEYIGLGRATEALMLAYYFTGDERFAEHTANLMRTWFIDPETRMNPRDEYSNVIPGIQAGTFNAPGLAGLIFNRNMLDSLAMLEASPHWSNEDKVAAQNWFRDFRTWAADSAAAKYQFGSPTNHGTSFDLAFAAIGIYVEDPEFTAENVEHYIYNRFPLQINADGSNPNEIIRANNMYYHRSNLEQMLAIAELGRLADSVDFATYEMEDGRSPRLALDFLIPYWTSEKEWTFWPDEVFPKEPYFYFLALRQAAAYFGDPRLLDAADSLGLTYTPGRYANMLYPEQYVLDQVWAGDANVDSIFDSADLVVVFRSGKYETGEEAGWDEGDWNRDGKFDSADLTLAFAQAGYEAGSRQASVIVVPEPQALPGVCLCFLYLVSLFRRQNVLG